MRLFQRTATEAEIKRQICEWLELKRCFFWVQRSSGMMRGKAYSSRYTKTGVPDILGVWNGQMIGIEVKRPGGRVSDDQAEFLTALNKAGGIGLVAYSLEDVIKTLEAA